MKSFRGRVGEGLDVSAEVEHKKTIEDAKRSRLDERRRKG